MGEAKLRLKGVVRNISEEGIDILRVEHPPGWSIPRQGNDR